MSGIVGSRLNNRGSGLIGSLGTDGQVLTSSGAGVGAVYEAGAIDDNAVTLAKMAGLARGTLIYGDTSGDPAALAVGGADEVLTHDGTDFDWAAASAGGGITNAQTFRVTAEFADSANPIASNWEEVDTDGYGQLGNNVSESSGIFSFSATGIYLIIWNHVALLNGDDRQVYSSIETTGDNSNYNIAAEVREFIQQTSSSSAMCTGSCFHQLDVTDTTNVKVRFHVGVLNALTTTLGDSGYTRTGVQFIRLGDT